MESSFEGKIIKEMFEIDWIFIFSTLKFSSGFWGLNEGKHSRKALESEMFCIYTLGHIKKVLFFFSMRKTMISKYKKKESWNIQREAWNVKTLRMWEVRRNVIDVEAEFVLYPTESV